MLFSICLSVVALTLVGLVVLVRAAFVAPYAAEDEHGFRVVIPADKRATAVEPETPVGISELAFFQH